MTSGTVQSSGGPATLGVGGDDDNTTFYGTLQDGAAANSQLAINVAENGTLILDGANTYTGGTFLDSGELSIASDANIGGPTSYIEFDGGTLQVTGASLTNLDSHAVNWDSFDGGLDIAAGNTFTVSETISGSGGLTKLGSGTLVLSGADTYTGQTVVALGKLNVEGSLTSPVALTGGSVNGAATPPQLVAGTSGVTAYVGQIASLGGSLSQWPDIAAVGLSASNSSGFFGTVVNNGDGTWTWTSPDLTSASDQTVTITATDGTNSATTSFDLTANPAVPENVYTTATLSNYETTATVNGLFSDPLPTDACTVTIDWGDETDPTTLPLNPGQTSFTSDPHTYAASGDYAITTTVTNAQGSGAAAITDATAYAFATVGIGADTPIASDTQTPGEFIIGRMDGGDISKPTDAYLLLDANSTLLLNTDFSVSSGTTDMHTQVDGCEEFEATIPAGSNTTTIDITPIDVDQIGGSLGVTMKVQSDPSYGYTVSSDFPSATVTINEDDVANQSDGISPMVATVGGRVTAYKPNGAVDPTGTVMVGNFERLVVICYPYPEGGQFSLSYNQRYFNVTSDEAGQTTVSGDPDVPLDVPQGGKTFNWYLWGVKDSTGLYNLTIALKYTPPGGDQRTVAYTPANARPLTITMIPDGPGPGLTDVSSEPDELARNGWGNTKQVGRVDTTRTYM